MMANELVTRFIFDEADAAKRIDATRKNLTSLNNDFNNLGKNLNVGKTISNEFQTAGRAAQSFKNQTVNSLKIDEPLRKALADIKNYQNQTIKGEREVTKSIEREAKLQADARLRAGRRSANEAINSLRSPSGGGNGFGGGSEFGSVLGSLPGGSIAQGAAFGGAAGAAAAATLLLVNAGKQLVSTVADLSVTSVKLAADFEETTNSLAVFAGGTREAKKELAEIDKIALNTPGLSLVDAEKGYQRLRALNFEAKTSQDLIKGLGTQRVLSGASADAVDRVVTNLIQLTSGAGTAADVRQTVGQLPTLLPIFKKAFGTQDFGKINDLAKENPDEFIKKFSAELANAKQAQAGLNVTLEKGKDVLIDLGRAFGEPFLDSVTNDVRDLTKFLQENKDSFREFGQNGADAFRALSDAARGAYEIISKIPVPQGTGSRLSEAAFGAAGIVGRRSREAAEADKPFAERFKNFKPGDLSNGFTVDFGSAGQSPEEIQAKRDEAERKALDEKDRLLAKKEEGLKKQQRLNELQNKIDLSEIDNNLKYKQAISNRAGNDPLKQIQETARIEQEAIRARIAAQNRFASESITNLSDKDFGDGKGIEIARASLSEINKLNNELAISQINANKQLADSGKKLVEDFRTSFSSLSANGNPLVKLMSDFETTTDRAEKQFGSFGKKVVEQIASIERANLQKAINLQNFQNNLEALNLTQDAEKLRATPENQFAPFQRNLETVERKVDSLSKIFQLNRQINEAGFYANQFNPNNPRSFNQSKGFDDGTAKIRNAVSDILGLKSLDIGSTGIFGKEAVADKILDSIPSRDELLTRLRDPRTSGDAQFLLSQQFSALQVKRQAEQQKLNDFLENQKFLEFGKKFANDKIGLINNSNLTDAQKAEQRLAVTNALGNDLDINLRRQKAEDLLATAANKQKETEEAKKIATDTRDAVQAIVKQLAEKGIKIDGGIGVTVKNETNGAADVSVDRASDQSDVDALYGEYQNALNRR
jgi:hypothetical protein